MSRSDVARRYAQALWELAAAEAGTDQHGGGEVLRAGLDRLVAILTATPDAAALLVNRTVAVARRRELLDRILAAAGTPRTAANLARLLLDRGRMGDLASIASAFGLLLDERSGKVEGTIAAATALSAADIDRIAAALGTRLGKTVTLRAEVDPALLGGLKVQIGNLIFDASVRNHLARLREQLGVNRPH